MERQQKTKGLNRDFIKYCAMFTMFLNHFATAFLSPGTVLYEVLIDIGYFTAVTMCYFLVEGYYYTHSKKKYAWRLFIFALISEVPYCLALGVIMLNMMFTLLLCFFILLVLDDQSLGKVKYVLTVLLVLASIFSDWALLAPVFTIMFYTWKDDRRKTALAFGVAAALFFGFNMLSYTGIYPAAEAFLRSVAASLGIVVSGIVILNFYNGKQAAGGRKFSKWFFYIFYPGHLLLIAAIRFSVDGLPGIFL